MGVDTIKTDYQVISNEEMSQDNFSSYIYNANFYMSLQKSYYTRRYAKIQDIIAIVGGLLTFFRFIGKTLYDTFNLSLKKIKIIDLFLDLNIRNDKNLSNEMINKSNSINLLINNNISNINYTNINMKNCLKNSFENALNNNNIYLNVNSYFSNSNSKNKYVQIPNKKILISKNKSLNTNLKMKLSSLIKIDLINKTICCYNCLYCNKKKKNITQKHIYNLVNDIYMEKCDVINYFNNLKIVRFIIEMLLNKYQILSLKELKKLNINDYFKFSMNKSDKIIEYFKNLYLNKINSKLDDYIFENFEDNFKYKIIRQYSK